jgi:hypothetical protein
LGVAEIGAAFVACAAGEFFGGAKARRFMAGLAEEVRDAQLVVDAVARQRGGQYLAHRGDDGVLLLGNRAAELRRHLAQGLGIDVDHGQAP